MARIYTSVIYFVVLLCLLQFVAGGVEADTSDTNAFAYAAETDAEPYDATDSYASSSSPLTYDFVIVGSGGAGSVLAARLSKETNKRVLVIEGGRRRDGQRVTGGTDYVAATFKTNPVTGEKFLDPTPLTRYDVPFMWTTVRDIPELRNTWNITAIGPFFTQAKVVGGNHAANGMAWVLPLRENFDAWNIPGYSGTEMWAYFKKIENATNTGVVSTNRGYSGPIDITSPTFLDTSYTLFRNASIAAGYPLFSDMNSGTDKVNVTVQNQANIKNGIRDSAAAAYLATALGRYNLDLWTSCTVTRVLFDNTKKATGVEFVDRFGVVRKVNAAIEVILASGTLMTPKILYNSGIGPASILSAFGKPPVYTNNLIGQKIRNQLAYSVSFNDPLRVPPNLYSAPGQFDQYALTGQGLPGSRGAFSTFLKVNPAHPHYDIALGSLISFIPPLYSQVISVGIGLAYNVYANGTVNLTSSDPLAPTVFNANAYVNDEDVDTIARAVLRVRHLMSFYDHPLTETSPGAQYNTIAALKPVIIQNGGAACHHFSSTPMGITAAFPVDQRMKMRGVTRLRIVGPAVAPGEIPQGMQALAVVLGEKGTDLIKADYGL